MSKYQTKQSGRPYAEVRGYLREELAAATVAAGVLTPASAALAVYATNTATDEWRYIGEAVVWNYDEAPSYCALHYCWAVLNGDDRFEQRVIHCEPTSLTIPDAPGA